VAAEVDHGLARDRGQRQGDEGADEAVDLAAEQQREDHQQRVDPQRLREHVRGDDVALDLLQRREGDRQPQRVERLAAEQRDEHRRPGADRRADVRDQLCEAVPGAEEQRVRLAVREDAERAEHPQHQPRARAHDQREQHLAADVAEDGALDPGRVVVAVDAVDHRPHAGADPLAVEQHVDADHDDQDQRQRGLDRRPQRVLGERHQLAGPLRQVLAERAERGLALVGDLDVDPVVVEPLLDIGERGVGVVDQVRHVVAEGRDLVGHRVGDQQDDRRQHRHHAEHHDQDGEAAGHVGAPQDAHERVQQQRDERADDEQQQDRAGGLEDDPQAEDGQRQQDQLYPPRDEQPLVHRVMLRPL
jgi:hypothetical protein